MKIENFIFRKSFEKVFTKERISFVIKKMKLNLDINNFFDFKPHRKIFIPKDEYNSREINIPDLKAKVIQKIIQEELSYALKFNSRSYAYQRGKSPLQAINRVKNIIKSYNFVIRCDIKDFFDSIDQDKLINTLEKIIIDRKILYLLILFIKNGSLFRGKWSDKLEGIYQGDVLSPLFANIYLHSFDTHFDKLGYEFIRFSDDLIFFSKNYNEAEKILNLISSYLNIFSLELNQQKSLIKHKSDKFEYLGVVFDEKNRVYSIENSRLMSKISNLSQETKKLNLIDAINTVNNHIRGFKNYYLKIINNYSQLDLLQKREDEILIDKIIESKKNKTITRKVDFYQILLGVKTYVEFGKGVLSVKFKDYPTFLIERAYEKIKFATPKQSAQKTIEKKRREYYKNYLKSTELIISKFSSYIYFSKGRVKVRTKDEPVKEIPFNIIQRIVILNKKTSLSSYLIYKCSQHGINIDFIDQNQPYAMISYFSSMSNSLYQKQLKIMNSKIALNYAKSLIFSKAKNQINLLKYFNQRRGDGEINKKIEIMEKIIAKIKATNSIKSLLGYEGQISQSYWFGFKEIIGVDNFIRTHKNSTDIYNQSLNYAYAILYSRVQSALLKEGLNIYYSFLHSQGHKKPTLVFDMVEIFRQPIVDREIISIITKHQKLSQSKGLLSETTKKLIIQHIQGRLSSFTKTRYGKVTYFNLIELEAHSLKVAIENEDSSHKFFIAKY